MKRFFVEATEIVYIKNETDAWAFFIENKLYNIQNEYHIPRNRYQKQTE